MLFICQSRKTKKMITSVTIGISPCVIREIKRELFMYVLNYILMAYEQRVQMEMRKKNGKNGIEIEQEKRDSLSSFAW